ncbi:MAG: MBL fold metallo-hydrolase [Gammaproteobacteria bacterium]|nr:MBL fold metallo-hydrolase [Gammaproteobacteria bacterium]MDH4315269.1 MBL fold metallo-hydrolase [Gammaproteobacteria bacterium]MDH5213965.1 MBL fold metallo-hydrolase [Gammaproteobacteria bacterium]MDH5500688.1 MBL fold metallo-hydrolase [Gammaproteobacteria bacterium]
MTSLRRRIQILGLVLLAVTGITMTILSRLWEERADIADLAWQYAEPADGEAGSVTATWFGVSTLLFDDGETQIMIDGAFTRIPLRDILTLRRVSSDIATINYALAEYRVDRLAAIVAVHSHFDHAIDIGHIANRSSAVVLGSESTAYVARGADVPVEQYQILASGESRQFGEFTITLINSKHAPIGFGDEGWLPGQIRQPLVQPARITAWREGESYSIVIGHPRGTTLVQGSGGFIKGNLRGVSVDVVMLSVAGLAGLGQDYVAALWRETVAATGARRLYPIHYEDFTRPLGEIILFPDIVDNVARTAGWINELAAAGENPVDIQLLPFGDAIVLY